MSCFLSERLKASKIEKKRRLVNSVANNVEHLRSLGIWNSSAGLLMLKSTIKFEFKRNESQRTKSVAKNAGDLEIVQPKAKPE